MKNLFVILVVLGAASALAMPSKQEINKAQPLVAELMAPAMDDYKAKKKTAAEVADAAVAFAAEAETEAAKFMLYRSSIPYYVRGEAYDKAAEAVTLLKSNVKDVPAEVVAEIISKATVRANKEKAPRLFELYRQAKTQATAEKDVRELRKKPASPSNKRKLAEALATAGDWPEALKEFANLRNDAALIAKKEQDGSGKSYEIGEFWWDYKPVYENAEDTFKIHAVAHYRNALAAGDITGLKKPIVEQRIKEYEGAMEIADGKANSAWQEKGNTATLDLGKGEKIEFVKCPPGEFKMLIDYGKYETIDVKMTRPFWISKTHMSKGQFQAAMKLPVDAATRTHRQSISRVKEQKEGMFEKMNCDYGAVLPAGYVIRYPSIAEWEYAYHANTRDANDPHWHTRTYLNASFDILKTKDENVGSTVANKWGITDLRAQNILMDRFDENELEYEGGGGFSGRAKKILKPQGTDPFYWTDNEGYVCQEIGCSFDFRDMFSEAKRDYTTWKRNFHLVVGPDLVSEWKAKHGKK